MLLSQDWPSTDSWYNCRALQASQSSFPQGPLNVEYREGIYVGYRYFDTADKEVLFPFGFGLSYTQFAFSDITFSSENIRDDDTLHVTFTVKNIGERDGAEVCQLYVGADNPKIFRPKKELKEFTKVYLKAGEQKTITFTLNKRAFAYYNVNSASFEVETGRYTVYVGDSLVSLPLQKQLRVTNTTGVPSIDYRDSAPVYYEAKMEGGVPDEQFKAVYRAPLPANERSADAVPDLNYSFEDMTQTRGGRVLLKLATAGASKAVGGTKANKKMLISMFISSPLRASALMSGGDMSMEMAEDILTMGTGHFWKGLFRLIPHAMFKGNKKRKEKAK